MSPRVGGDSTSKPRPRPSPDRPAARPAPAAAVLVLLGLSWPAPAAASQEPPAVTPEATASATTRPKAKPTAKAKPATPPAVAAPDPFRVMSKAEQGGRGSSFLRAPGADRYDPAGEDWRDVPPWRQASFFGIRAKGQFFVYVVDCSGSMVDEDRLARAKEALRQSVRSLQPPQRFMVIFYNDGPVAMPGGLPRPADLQNKDQLIAWLRLIEPDGGTDPRAATGLGLAHRPDAVFLLSDGAFPDGAVAAIARQNARKVPIHCVDLSGGLAGDHLKRIAGESGGRYVMRPYQGE